MKTKNKKGLARLLEIAGEKKYLLIFSCVFSVVSALSMLVPYLSVYKILQHLLQNATDISKTNYHLLTSWGWIALIGLGIGLITLYCSTIFSHVAAFNILYKLRIKVSEHIGKLSLGFLNSSSTGAIKKTMEQNIEKIESFIAHTIPDIIGVVATIIFMFAIFFSLNVWLALVVLLIITVAFSMQIFIFFGKKSKDMVRYYFDSQETMSASAVEYVRGIPVVKIFSQSVNSFRNFVKEINTYKDYALKVCDMYESPLVRFAVLLNSIVIFLLPIGILLWYHTPQTLAFATVWLFFIIMSPGLSTPLFKFMHLGSSTKEIDEGVKRIDDILNVKPYPQTSNPQVPENYTVEFHNVSFSYDDKSENKVYALKNVSFIAKEHQTTALVGASGSGKSTIASLIPRFWDVKEGFVTIGNVNVKDILQKDLMNLVSFVFQDTFLFLDTIANNISMGNGDADMQDIIQASKLAQCHDFIMNLKDGYNTRIGEEGINLSGGERQRICLARAIYKNAPILVLDEATAFSDTENEKKIQTAINNLMQNKTVIIIAHRLTTIKNADKIVVMDKGRISQQGNHNELIDKEGVYKNMWQAFTSALTWKLEQQ